ncbi:MAG: FAD-binding oxidoreductase [archaeon]
MKKDLKLAYESDASGLKGAVREVLFPMNIEQVRDFVKKADNIVVRGGGTGLAGGAVPHDSIVMDLSKMNKILDLDLDKGEVYVESGIILNELNEYLKDYGLEFPVQPGSFWICTIGGMIATNAEGSRAVKYGKTSNWVKEIEVVDGRGEILKIGKSDLHDIAGMEGITGVIVKARLKLESLKERTASLFKFSSKENVVDAVRKFKLMSDVSMIEFYDKTISSLLDLDEAYHLLVEFESDRGNMKGKDYFKIIKIRAMVYPSLATLGYVRIEDPKIFIGKFPEFAEWLEQEKIPFYGHLGDGLIHPVFHSDEDHKIKEMMYRVRKLHGKVSGEHGIGITKKEFLDPNEIKLIKRLKNRYDPVCKINCGKVVDPREKSEKEEIFTNES